MTPIQQAIEQVKKRMDECEHTKITFPDNMRLQQAYSLSIRVLQIQLNYLQSLLPIEKEWARDVWVTSNQEASNYPHALDFEQYYSQLNEVK